MATPTLRLLTEREAAPPVELVELEAVSWMLEGICPSAQIHEYTLAKETDQNTNR
jgi:hypothetical protein